LLSWPRSRGKAGRTHLRDVSQADRPHPAYPLLSRSCLECHQVVGGVKTPKPTSHACRSGWRALPILSSQPADRAPRAGAHPDTLPSRLSRYPSGTMLRYTLYSDTSFMPPPRPARSALGPSPRRVGLTAFLSRPCLRGRTLTHRPSSHQSPRGTAQPGLGVRGSAHHRLASLFGPKGHCSSGARPGPLRNLIVRAPARPPQGQNERYSSRRVRGLMAPCPFAVAWLLFLCGDGAIMKIGIAPVGSDGWWSGRSFLHRPDSRHGKKLTSPHAGVQKNATVKSTGFLKNSERRQERNRAPNHLRRETRAGVLPAVFNGLDIGCKVQPTHHMQWQKSFKPKKPASPADTAKRLNSSARPLDRDPIGSNHGSPPPFSFFRKSPYFPRSVQNRRAPWSVAAGKGDGL